MTSPELENLASAGALKHEPCTASEFQGLVRSGEARLSDAANAELAIESRFDLAYNAAFALALAALRARKYRPANRFVVFQVLPHTLGVSTATWRVLAKCHERRNLAEYEGVVDVDERLMADLLVAGRAVLEAIRAVSFPEAGHG